MTLRFRWTALYAGLFLVASSGVLVTVNLLLRRMLADEIDALPDPLPALPAGGGTTTVTVNALDDLRDAVLRFQWGVAAATVVVLTVVSAAGGWWVTGRLLRRLGAVTATARRLSLSTLDERLRLDGPRDELRELGDVFDSMLDRLEHSVRSQRQFVANASHELRTPLAVQRAAIEIGLDDPDPAQLARVRRELLDANRRTGRLIEGLLTLAQGGHGLDRTEPVRLDAAVRQAVGETGAGTVRIDVGTVPVVVPGDPVLLGRLVANLVDNAVRHNVPGGTGGSVSVSVSAGGTLIVANTGPPVPPGRVGDLFAPFHRLDGGRTGGGAGLGLSIVDAIARAHGADITARANPGGGLTLTVRFPSAVEVTA